jgi:hypothetical protein
VLSLALTHTNWMEHGGYTDLRERMRVRMK